MRARHNVCTVFFNESVRFSPACLSAHICVWDVYLSHSAQLAYIKGKTKDEGLKNVDIMTCDINAFQPDVEKYVCAPDVLSVLLSVCVFP